MVSGSRCPPGPWGLLALLLLLLLPPLARGTCNSPPRLHFAELPGAVNDSYPVGTKLKYSCRPGYILSSGKSPLVTCLENSTWSVDPEFCVGRPCKQLELENGRVDLTDLRFGATANFSCNEGHRLIGATSAQCVLVENRVDWDKEVPLCQAIPCLPPPDIAHGSHNGQSGEEFSFGSAVTYKCDTGLSLIGEASIHCTTKDNVNGEWSGPAPECKAVKCPEPEVKNGKKQSGFGSDYSYGNTVIFECDSGYTLHGSSSVRCDANSSWVPSLPTCRGTCDSPPRLSFAELPGAVNDSYPVGTKLKYSCRPGYILSSGKSPLVMCLENSTWSVDPEFCVGRPCKPLELENGRVDLTDLRFGATANFSCNEGHRLIGATSAQCVLVENRVDWDKEVPLCQAIPCLPPPDIAHGSHNGQSGEEFSFGSAVTYKCDTGLSLIGEASIHCTTKDNVNGEWSGPAPECKVVKCPEPEVKNGKKQSGFGPDYSYGNTVIFECDSGYTLIGSSSVKCEANNSWVPSLPTCLGTCNSPPRLHFAELSGVVNDSYLVGTKLKYSCRPGYILSSGKSPLVTCLENSTWSVDPEFCVGRPCKPLELENGRVDLTDLRFGATANFSCNEGHRLIGATSAQCVLVENRVDWDKEVPLCQAIPCLPPPDIAHGSHNGQSGEEFSFGSAVTYKCDTGLSLIGEASIHCTTKDNVNGEWSGPAPECKVVKCPEPEVKNGKKQSGFGPDYSYGNTVIFECDSGYILIGSSSVKCEANNSWVPSLPTCLGRPCKPLELENGRVDLTDLRFGATANFSCNEGHRLIGATSAQCVLVENRVDWDKEVPLCQAIPCLPPPDIAHGSHNGQSGEEFSFGSAVTYKCDTGLSLIGEASIHCTTKDNVNGEWSGPAPECKGPNTGTMIAIGVVIGLLLAGGIVAIVTHKACFGEKGPYDANQRFSDLQECEKKTCLGLESVSFSEVRCPAPQIQNGRRVSGDRRVYLYNDSVTFECDPGYTMKGHSLSRCQTDDTWDPPLPVCEPEVLCSSPEIQNGRKVAGHGPVYRPRDTVRFECDPGYTMNGSRQIQCRDEGTWDPPVPACTQMLPCPPPPVIVKGTHNAKPLAAFPSGTYVNYSCEPGYTLRGEASIYCTTSGTWSHPSPLCEGEWIFGWFLPFVPPDVVHACRIDMVLFFSYVFPFFPVGCGVPTRLSFAELRNEYKNQNNFSVEETAKYTCRSGYRRDPQLQPVITCLENGSWSKALEFCKKKSCGHPGEPENGRVIVTDIHFGSTVNFTCEEGHRLIGQPYRRCEISSTRVAWSGDVPICERIPCLPPPDIPNGRHTGVIMEDFSYGSAVIYECDNGYPLTGEASIHCTTKDGLNGEWSARPPRCGEVRCPAPQIQNGRRVSGDRRVYLYNDSVTFECDPGYTMKGHSLSRCQTDDTWDPPLPVCEPEVLCSSPEIQNGRKVAGHGPVYRPRDTVRFECDPGYTMNGSRQIQCRDEGTWDPPVPACTQMLPCPPPPVIVKGTHNAKPLAAFPSGTYVNYSCEPGYTLRGEASIYCTTSGTWSHPSPLCEGGCGVPTRLSFAELKSEYNQSSFPVGKTINYTCRPGYSRHPHMQSTITCLENRTWSEAFEFCKKKSCGHPGEPENGRVIVTDIHFGSTVNFTCEEGHRLIGRPYRLCEISGTRVGWSGDVPICERIPCLPPPDIPNGSHTGKFTKNFSFGSAVTYKCENGYLFTGEASIHCTTKDGLNGVWSARPPQCGEVRCPAPQIQNGRRVSGDRRVYLYNDSVTFECDPGYTMKGHSLSRCQTDDTWDPPLPVCEPEVLCSSPEIQNGRKVAGHGPVYRPRDTVRFECDPGYTMNGSRQIQCRDEGTWDPPVPACTQMLPCPPPPVIVKGTHNAKPLAAFPSGTYVNYSCEPGYTLRGEASIYCTTSGTWSHPSPLCEGGCGVPTRLSFAELKSEYKNQSSFPVGKTINYTCRPGYSRHPHMQSTITCLENRTWSEAFEFCKKKSCGHPGEPENGRVIVTDIHFGSTVNFTCEEGHRLIGQPYRRCEISGMHVAWSGDVPICEQLRCPAPQIQNGRRVSGDRRVYLYNDSVTFECDPGYTMKGHSLSRCQTDDTWDPPLPVCEPAMCVSPEVENGRTNGVQPAYRPSDMVVFECDPGYTMSGSPETQCQDDGRWDPPFPVCERLLQCPFPPAITNGKPSVQALAVFTTGTSVNYSCEPGYSLNGQASIYCAASGIWSPPPPQCEEVICIAPEIQNGRKVAGHGPVYRPRDTVRFECDPGYTLNASHRIQCRDDGTWDPPVPACTQVLPCPPPPVIVKGTHNAKPLAAFPSGTYVNYSCEPGYALRGEASIYCTTSGTWSHSSPLCKGSYNFISVVLGIAGGSLLLLLVTIIISRIMSKQNAGYYYTHENSKYRMPLAHITEQKNSFAP
ncbi:LOW QUALITY PROTEIN: complement receptor type 1-like [Dermochelys coriacea]|uniref:LOW QUALITY PROTEIN: complement receptor type 1-like n=1 Tax=Dermochelys coriacea TaxID=27794 RepID=UPI001CA82FF1|nr:LOW QUALITY PROTEIN: complement receptor type 1-like [Dermochelys coriacea]